MIGYILYLVFIVSFFIHLTSRISILGLIRFDLTLGIVLIVLALINLIKKREIKLNKDTTKWLLIIIGYIILSLPFVRWPGSVLRYGMEFYLQAVIFYLFTISFIDTKKKLYWFLLIFIGCQVWRTIEPAYLHLAHGYWGSSATASKEGIYHTLARLSGAPHDVVNPNQLAWVIVSNLIFIYYIGWKSERKLKVFSITLAPICLYTFILTGSRSGMISLMVALIALLFFEKKSKKAFFIAAIILIPVGILISVYLSTGLIERYRSIFDPTAVGRSTFDGRINALKGSFKYMSDYVVVGHGIGTSHETNANLAGFHRITHSLYIEIIQELGIIGLALFFFYIRAIWINLIKAKGICKGLDEKNSWFINLLIAIQVWIVMDLIYSISYAGLKSWEWYLFGGLSAVCYKLSKEIRVMPKKTLNKNLKLPM